MDPDYLQDIDFLVLLQIRYALFITNTPTERIRQRANRYTMLNASRDLCRCVSVNGILFYSNNLFVGFLCKFRNDRLLIGTGNENLQIITYI